MLTRTATRQANQVFATLIQSVKNCPESILGLHAVDLHASVGCLAMHIGSSLEGAFDNPQFREKWSSPVSSKEQCLAYLADCRDLLMLDFIANNDLATPDAQPEYFVSKLDRVMKLLRHVAHHTGEMDRFLRDNGVQVGRFV